MTFDNQNMISSAVPVTRKSSGFDERAALIVLALLLVATIIIEYLGSISTSDASEIGMSS